MRPLRSRQIPSGGLQRTLQQMGAVFYSDRSNGVRHIYYARRLRRWVAVSNEGRGYLIVNEYSECPCGATR